MIRSRVSGTAAAAKGKAARESFGSTVDVGVVGIRRCFPLRIYLISTLPAAAFFRGHRERVFVQVENERSATKMKTQTWPTTTTLLVWHGLQKKIQLSPEGSPERNATSLPAHALFATDLVFTIYIYNLF